MWEGSRLQVSGDQCDSTTFAWIYCAVFSPVGLKQDNLVVWCAPVVLLFGLLNGLFITSTEFLLSFHCSLMVVLYETDLMCKWLFSFRSPASTNAMSETSTKRDATHSSQQLPTSMLDAENGGVSPQHRASYSSWTTTQSQKRTSLRDGNPLFVNETK